MDWELISFIKRSKQRMHILMTFHSGETPTEIVKKTNLAPSHISRTLKEFSEKDLIRCETPNDHIGRVYVLTEKGEEIQNILRGGKIAERYSK